MAKLLKTLLVILMVITWLVTAVVAVLSPSVWGKVASIGTGLLVNGLLAFAYSCAGQRPSSFRDWFKM
ncbi:hypothetical protein ACFPMF_11540 [Larkinella bovis]|uniref:Uncharacterized protein n=1 Tax=Larkinella bovis TaxID=683041 RepID=A0ABW0I9H9_9BACT